VHSKPKQFFKPPKGKTMEKMNFIPNTTPELEVVYVCAQKGREGLIVSTSRIVSWRIEEDGWLEPVTAKWGIPGERYNHYEPESAAMMLMRDTDSGLLWDELESHSFLNIDQCVAYLRKEMEKAAAEQPAQQAN
jgi:hypothetical protein